MNADMTDDTDEKKSVKSVPSALSVFNKSVIFSFFNFHFSISLKCGNQIPIIKKK